MLEIIIKVITNREVIIISLFFLIILYILFPTPRTRSKSGKIIKRPSKNRQKRNLPLKEEKAIKEEIDEPGKLYVPDSTYEILKKEKRINIKD